MSTIAQTVTLRHGAAVAHDTGRVLFGPAGTEEPFDLAPTESLVGWFDDDGRYHLRGELDADHGRIVDAALAEAREMRRSRAGHTNATWAEALVEIARRSLDGAVLDEAAETVPRELVHRPDRPGPGPLGRRVGGAGLAPRPAVV